MSGRPGDGQRRLAQLSEKLLKPLGRRVRLGAPVNTIIRDAFGVTIWAGDAVPQRFDHVIIAAHSDQALAMSATPPRPSKAFCRRSPIVPTASCCIAIPD